MSNFSVSHRAMSAAAVLAAISGSVPGLAPNEVRAEAIQVGFLWHMHQPIYIP